MVNGSNGETTLLVVTPQVVEEPKTGLVPKLKLSRLQDFLGTNEFFVSAHQYHWHVQGAVGANNTSRHHITTLAQRLHQFGHRTKEREMGFWHRLSNAMDLPGVERLFARNQEIWEAEYNKFVNELSVFVNKELSEFRHSIVSMGEFAIGFRISNTQGHEST